MKTDIEVFCNDLAELLMKHAVLFQCEDIPITIKGKWFYISTYGKLWTGDGLVLEYKVNYSRRMPHESVVVEAKGAR